jgi:hypothetical protein
MMFESNFCILRNFDTIHCSFSSTDGTCPQSRNSMHSRRVFYYFMVLLWMIWYHTTQGGSSIGFRAHQYWHSDRHGWDSHIRGAISCQDWIQFQMSSRRWLSSRSLQLRALLPPGEVQGVIPAWDTDKVVLSGFPTRGRPQNSMTGVEPNAIHHWQCRECRFRPK